MSVYLNILNIFCNAILWPDFSHGRSQSSNLLMKPAGFLFHITYANIVLGLFRVGGFWPDGVGWADYAVQT